VVVKEGCGLAIGLEVLASFGGSIAACLGGL
jgi:hypothetical protein